MGTGVIIGNSTTVSFGAACVVSVSWGMEPGRQDVYCLGSFLPSDTHSYYRPQLTMSITCYSPGPSYNMAASESCVSPETITASVSPGSCGTATGGGISSGDWMVSSYSYSKMAPDQPGQESWSLVDYTSAASSMGAIVPSFILGGTPTGSATDADIAGIVFSKVFSGSFSSGSVSANSTGTASESTFGVVSKVGGGSITMGDSGQGNASFPLTPMYF